MEQCPKCQGKKHRKEGLHWVRCECLKEIARKQYLGELYEYDPLPAEEWGVAVFFYGEQAKFKRALAGYLRLHWDMPYSVMDAHRLVEIFVGNDEDTKTIRSLHRYDLLVVLLDVGHVKNQRLDDLIKQAHDTRVWEGKKIWFYSSSGVMRLRHLYGDQTGALLEKIRTVEL